MAPDFGLRAQALHGVVENLQHELRSDRTLDCATRGEQVNLRLFHLDDRALWPPAAPSTFPTYDSFCDIERGLSPPPRLMLPTLENGQRHQVRYFKILAPEVRGVGDLPNGNWLAS